MILKRICSTALAASVLLCGTALASEVSVKYNNSEKLMEIEGSIGETANALVTVAVYDDVSKVDFSNPLLFSTVYTSEGGAVDFDLKTTSGFQSGKYIIYLSTKDAKAQGVLNYVSEEGLTEAMNAINAEDDSVKIADIIKSSKRNLGLGDSVSDGVIETAAKILLINKTGEYTDTEAFYDEFNRYIATAYLNESDDTLATLKKYQTELGIDYDSLLETDERTLGKLLYCIKNADYTKGLLTEQLSTLTLTAAMLKSETWSELKYVILGLDDKGEKINNNFELFAPDTEYYDKVKSVNNVYKELLEKADEAKTIEDLREFFEECAEKVYRDEKDSSGGSGGGGGSSSGGGGKVALTPYAPVEIVTPHVPDVPVSDGAFSDISSHWAKADIEALSESGIISGYPDGSFMPDKAVSRAEFVKLITLAFELSSSDAVSDFDDVAPDAWYKAYVDTAVGAGLIKGVSQNRFNPDGMLSREDASLILFRHISGITTLESSNNKFADDAVISDYAKEAVYGLCAAGIINGMENGNFEPKSELTRAQACKLLSSILTYLEAFGN